ncbi:RsmB/NOP family class I SAM-dependent RNA methyltransferase [Parvibaculum sp.]|uniref:RsmB/NOP family class I SAM-dependent RNA methyltransferase n=1 Tax=Parvibaculum sp. TaxID=2024848 RepID=UPI000C8C6FF1|nr:RsmB/NOP family class I SAM-dependent RNA methyltransferase [Parvibaculum sp.]MAB12519.1 MFS transporter [Parvibaculum sp.]
MTPGARLSAAIDILVDIFRSETPADRIFENGARASRYAGSKDHAAVSAIVYGVLRHKAELEHALGAPAHEATPRLMAAGWLTLRAGEEADAVLALMTGEKYAPEPASEEEAAALTAAALPGPEAAPHIRLNYPDWLQPEFEDAFGERLEPELAALMDRAPTDLRANTLKASREEALATLKEAGVEVEEGSLSPWSIRLLKKANLPALKPFRDGLVEIQDEGSQLACLLAGARPGEQAVDLCAGGGGKSLALAATMENHGQIFACDLEARRLKALMPRAQRAGCRNIQTMPLHPWVPGEADPDLAELTGRADLVLVDAPCSGTGAWRRSPDARWRLTTEKLAAYRAAQAEVLERAAPLVKPGGRLVYVTCSLLPSENEDRVAAFLAAHEGFAAEPWTKHWPEDLPRPASLSGIALRLSPATSGTDGFFVAILRRRA